MTHHDEKLKAAWDGFGGDDLLNVPLSQLNDTVYDLLNRKKESLLNPGYRLEGCMDEGASGTSIDLGGPGIVLSYYAGKRQGLDGWRAISAGSETTARILTGEVDGISSHDGCGACGIIYGLLSDEEKRRFANCDELGVVLAKELAEKLSVDYRHIPWNEMARPEAGHTARMVFYTGTVQFCIDECLPAGIAFIVSRGTLEKLDDKAFAVEIGKFLLDTACQIATSDHGLGERADSRSPFVIVPVGGDRVPLPVLRQESLDIAAKYPDNVVVLDGFTL